MANVVIGLADPYLDRGIARDAEFVACTRLHPSRAACQFVIATASHALHDLWCPRVECQSGWQHDTHCSLTAIGQSNAVAHAFTVKVDVGLGRDADVVNAGSGHGRF